MPPRTDAALALLLVAAGVVLTGRAWLEDHPEHDPWAPLDLRDPRGWATPTKLAALHDDPQECRAVLTRSEVAFTALEPTGANECRREDRLTLGQSNLSPANAQMTCAVGAGLTIWIDKDVQPLAEEMLGSGISSITQLGTYSCRRMYGSESGRWSEHATGNAIDIAGFTLEDGRQISVLRDWDAENDSAAFLRAVRDRACENFGTVLSPDYNAAHADHFHLDQGRSPGFGACR